MCRQLPEVNEKIRTLRDGKEKSENFEKDYQTLTKKREGIYLHEAQLQTQRAEIEKIRQKLDYNQCLVVSDFCGHYCTNNKKI